MSRRVWKTVGDKRQCTVVEQRGQLVTSLTTCSLLQYRILNAQGSKFRNWSSKISQRGLSREKVCDGDLETSPQSHCVFCIFIVFTDRKLWIGKQKQTGPARVLSSQLFIVPDWLLLTLKSTRIKYWQVFIQSNVSISDHWDCWSNPSGFTQLLEERNVYAICIPLLLF